MVSQAQITGLRFYREADVILFLGGVCDFRLNYGRSFHPKTKIIAVNRDRRNLYKNAYLFWKPEVGYFDLEHSRDFDCGLA